MLESLVNALNAKIGLWSAGELVVMLSTAIALVVIVKLRINGKLTCLEEPLVYEEIEVVED